jgi:hypothetical protein
MESLHDYLGISDMDQPIGAISSEHTILVYAQWIGIDKEDVTTWGEGGEEGVDAFCHYGTFLIGATDGDDIFITDEVSVGRGSD